MAQSESNGRRRIVELLHQRGVPLEPFLAAELGMLACVKAAAEADPGFVTEFSAQGSTTLHRAAFRGHLRILRLLLDSGADPKLAGYDGIGPHAGQTAADIARAHNQWPAAELLSNLR